MAKLHEITIIGFKSIASIEKLRLEDINVIVGPNGSGKSNFIGVFAFLRHIRLGGLQDYVVLAGGAEKVLHFGSKVTDELELRISFQENVNQYELKLMPSAGDTLVPYREVLYFWDKQRYSEPYFELLSRSGKEAGISDPENQKTATHICAHLDSWRLYHVHDTSSSSPIKKTADLNDNQHLREDGSNIAAFLYFLKEKHESAYGLIRRAVQRVAPFFDDFQLEPQRLNPSKIQLEWKHQGSDAYFDASSLSDGTLRFIVLATLLLQPQELQPSIILVDEPELGLHPYAITFLASMIKQTSVQTQVIISTQSPLLLDHFEPEHVLVADRIEGGTQLTRLNSADLEVWLDDYSLGQLWEKNEIGGRPKPERR